MKNKVLAVLVILKISILAIWLSTSIGPFPSVAAKAGLPPDSETHHAAKDEVRHEVQRDSNTKGFIRAIRRKEEELKTREDELVKRKRHLTEISGDIDRKVTELKSLVKELKSIKGEIDIFNNGKAMRLVKIYENMAPQDAAARIERLDDKMAASILGSMKEKIAGKILGFVNVDKSVKISRVLKKDIK